MSRMREGRSRAASASASHRTSRPSASVLPTSTVMPLRVRIMSRGRKALPATEFSTAGTRTRSRTGSFSAITTRARPMSVAAPPMSFFIFSMPDAGFRSRPPLSKHTPLPTSVSFGRALVAPGEVDEPRRPHAGAADGVDGRVVRGEQPVADDELAVRAQLRRHVLGGLGQLGRAHVLGRRVDEVAGERESRCHGLDPGAVGIGRPFELRRAALAPLVAGEAIGP